MKEIVKLGYKKLKFNLLYWVYIRYYADYNVSDLKKDKENLRKNAKRELVVYYLKSALLQKPIIQCDFITTIQVEKDFCKIVTIPQKELEVILLKNKLGGYLTSNIVQEKEFDKIFDELYPKLIERINFYERNRNSKNRI